MANPTERLPNHLLLRGVISDTLRERDGDNCQLCHKPLVFDGSVSIALDHIVPLARGGSNSLTNLQLTHRSCNSSKGPIHDPKQLGLHLVLTPEDRAALNRERSERRRLECAALMAQGIPKAAFIAMERREIPWCRTADEWRAYKEAEVTRWVAVLDKETALFKD